MTTPNTDKENGFDEYKRLILSQLKEARIDIRGLDNKLDSLEKSFEKLRTRVNIYSALGGAGAGMVMTVAINLIMRAI